MSKTLYWAVQLNGASKAILLSKMSPLHEKVFADHMTIAFRPDDTTDKEFMDRIDEEIELVVVGEAKDQKGQAAVVVPGHITKPDGLPPHITISCAPGTKPVYSNTLIGLGWSPVSPFSISGLITRFTS